MVHHLLTANSTAVTTETFCHHHPVNKSRDITVADALIDEISHIHYHLSQVVDHLKPSEHVNTLFTKLVTICTFQYDDKTVVSVLNDVHIAALAPSLRAMASQGEYFLELTWATDLVEQTREYQNAKPKLSRFIYYQNYVDLVQLELHALQGVGAQLDNIVFVGSGPLPLSPILMYQKLSASRTTTKMHNIDRDQESINISGKLLEKLDIARGFEQHVLNAIDYTDYDQADVVILGALVGQDVEEKVEFVKSIGEKMRSGTFIMARSAHSLRKLLYPSIEPYQVNACGFETVLVLHPYNDVVNSILIAKKI